MSNNSVPYHKSPEFMAKMREKANAKRAELKKLKEAEKIKLKAEHEKKLQEADELLNPKPKKEPKQKQPEPVEEIEPESESETENTPIEKVVAKPKKEKPQTNFKELYYKLKVERMTAPPPEPPPHPTNMPYNPNRPLPYEHAMASFKKDIDRQLMDNLFKKYWKTDSSPWS